MDNGTQISSNKEIFYSFSLEHNDGIIGNEKFKRILLETDICVFVNFHCKLIYEATSQDLIQ